MGEAMHVWEQGVYGKSLPFPQFCRETLKIFIFLKKEEETSQAIEKFIYMIKITKTQPPPTNTLMSPSWFIFLVLIAIQHTINLIYLLCYYQSPYHTLIPPEYEFYKGGVFICFDHC